MCNTYVSVAPQMCTSLNDTTRPNISQVGDDSTYNPEFLPQVHLRGCNADLLTPLPNGTRVLRTKGQRGWIVVILGPIVITMSMPNAGIVRLI